ncbi:MAG: hypothetical protein AAFZ49_01390, partial [Cyanobacteria bacterium J06659_2]
IALPNGRARCITVEVDALGRNGFESSHERRQRNYYDHIIRHETALHNIRHYIQTNPQRWQTDQLHPDSPSKW